MRLSSSQFTWFTSGLFWRTFFYLALLVISSMLAWVSSYRIIEEKPRAEQKSAQIISIVTITRAALTHSAVDKRRELLQDLANNEGIQIYLLEKEDDVVLQEQTDFFLEMKKSIHQKLAVETQFAKQVNGEVGFWVSFNIADDQYWLRLDKDKINPDAELQVLGWAAISLILTLFGAVFISKLINDPLSKLSIAARLVAKGEHPARLPEQGPKEIRETNASFNQMVEDLARIDSDRTIILAGISHDLRTPLTRMQLEVEMANLHPDARLGMLSDLGQMDAIIRQFLDYAKPFESSTIQTINLSDLLLHCVENAKRFPNTNCVIDITSELMISGSVTDLQRMLSNVFENAHRYGRTPIKKQIDVQESKSLTLQKNEHLVEQFTEKTSEKLSNQTSRMLELEVSCKLVENGLRYGIEIQIRDHGSGLPIHSLETVLRPFTRVNEARSQANGAGLGLAIVDRVMKRHGGEIHLSNHTEGGLIVRLEF